MSADLWSWLNSDPVFLFNAYTVLPCYTAKLGNWLYTEFFPFIKPLIHPLYRNPPHIFYVRTRPFLREKLIEYHHQRSISDEADQSHAGWWHTPLYRTAVLVMKASKWKSLPSPTWLYCQYWWYTELVGITRYYCIIWK